MKKPIDNNAKLRSLIEKSGKTQVQVLDLVNENQAFPIPLSTWKSYLAGAGTVRRRGCADNVLRRAEEVLAKQ